MLIISREQVRSLRERLANSSELGICLEEVERMLEIKKTLLWRADAGSCCIGTSMPRALDRDVNLLEDVLDALNNGDIVKGTALLGEFEKAIE